MLLDHCYCPYICTILKYVHHFANIANKNIKFTVFNALAKYIDQQVDVSALEILHLPTLSNYDGIIIQGNRA